MLMSKMFFRWTTITPRLKRLDKFLLNLSSKNPVNDQDNGILKSNPYFDKYAEKIQEMKETSPDELKERLASLLKKNIVQGNKPQHTQTKRKKLDDLLYVEILKGKPAEEVRSIWENHKHGEHKFATSLHIDVYKKLEEMSKLCPTFLYPLPRTTGFEFILSQFSGQEVHFSPLINYKVFRENAPVCLTMTHYTDIADSSQLVLVLGEFNKDILDLTEAVCLYHQLQRYYGDNNPRRLRMIQQFNHSPLDFLHMDLIAELESLK